MPNERAVKDKIMIETLCENCRNYFNSAKGDEECRLQEGWLQRCPVNCPDFADRRKWTNADRIKSMTDEDLADFLDSIIQDWHQGTAQIGDRIIISWFNWLKEEAEEEKE